MLLCRGERDLMRRVSCCDPHPCARVTEIAAACSSSTTRGSSSIGTQAKLTSQP